MSVQVNISYLSIANTIEINQRRL